MLTSVEKINTFIYVVDTGSFTRAAARLNLSKSVVSLHIKALESELSTTLLHRTTRQFTLTESGQALYQQFKPLLQQFDIAMDAVRTGTAQPQGPLSFSAAAEFGGQFLLPQLPAFTGRYPLIRADYRVDHSLSDLIALKLDVVFRLGTLSDSGLRFRKLADFPVCYVATPAFIRQHRVTESSDPAALPFIANSNLTARINRRQYLPAPDNRVFISNSIQAIRTMTLAHQGYSLLPVWYIREQLTEEKLVPVFTRQPVPDQSINMVFPPAAHLPQKVRVFIDYFARFFADNAALLRYP